MVSNPILVDEKGKRIYTSLETDNHPSQIIFESKFLNNEEIKPVETLRQIKTEDEPEFLKPNKPCPFFISMIDGFRIHNRIIDHLNDQFENDKYESLKKSSNVLKHVVLSEKSPHYGGWFPSFWQNQFY